MLGVTTGRAATTNPALLIEQDEAYAGVLYACLRLGGCSSTRVATPEDALAELDRRNFELLVWGVPAAAGAARAGEASRSSEFIGELRLRTLAPLVVLAGGAGAAQEHFDAGANHWLPKPFEPGAVVGCVRGALRGGRSLSASASITPTLRVRGMTLDGGRRRLTFGCSTVCFTRQEWELLAILFSHPNRFLSAGEILDFGWRAGDHAREQIRTYVHRLREKLEPLNLPCRLASQHRQGYCLEFADAQPANQALLRTAHLLVTSELHPPGRGRPEPGLDTEPATDGLGNFRRYVGSAMGGGR
jgi:DNA-binding response OmpR family regulator